MRCAPAAGPTTARSLDDGILIKDNHIRLGGGVAEVVRKMKAAHLEMPIEIEAQSLEQVDQALAAGVDIILLDNLPIEEVRVAVRTIAGRAKIELSGGVTLERIAELARTGADYVSVGALTHSAPAVDLSFELEPDPSPHQSTKGRLLGRSVAAGCPIRFPKKSRVRWPHDDTSARYVRDLASIIFSKRDPPTTSPPSLAEHGAPQGTTVLGWQTDCWSRALQPQSGFRPLAQDCTCRSSAVIPEPPHSSRSLAGWPLPTASATRPGFPCKSSGQRRGGRRRPCGAPETRRHPCGGHEHARRAAGRHTRVRHQPSVRGLSS